MSDNTLEVGQVRVGWLYPGEVEEGKGIPATLVRDKHRIRALIPVTSRYSSSPAARWKSEHFVFGDDPKRTEYQYDTPENMYFVDNLGRVFLMGCRSSGVSERIGFKRYGGILQKVSVSVAIFSSRKYNTNSFNGYQTEIENLSQWFHMDTLKTKSVYEEKDGRYRIKYVETRASFAEEIIIDELRGMKFKSSFSVSPNNSLTRVLYESHDILETYRDEEVPFEDGMKGHDVIRDLLMISSWSAHQFISISVLHNDDKGVFDTPLWRDVISEKWKTVKSADNDDEEFIFTYSDIGTEGICKWFEICEKYPRALNPILSTIRWESGTVENELFNLCSGVEALGRYIYQESPDRSLGGGKSGKIYLHNALQNIINQIPKGVLPYVKKFENSRNGKVVNSLPDWADKINNSYNSVKHYGDEEIDYDNIFESIDLLRIIIVSWVGTRLGAKPEILRDSLINKNYEFRKYLPPLDDAGYVIEEQEPEQGSEPAE